MVTRVDYRGDSFRPLCVLFDLRFLLSWWFDNSRMPSRVFKIYFNVQSCKNPLFEGEVSLARERLDHVGRGYLYDMVLGNITLGLFLQHFMAGTTKTVVFLTCTVTLAIRTTKLYQ